MIGDVVYVGGTFTQAVAPNRAIGGRANLAAFCLADGNLLDQLRRQRLWHRPDEPGKPTEVWALTTDGTNLFVGGNFNAINGTAVQPLAKLDPSPAQCCPSTPARSRTSSTHSTTSADGSTRAVTSPSGQHPQGRQLRQRHRRPRDVEPRDRRHGQDRVAQGHAQRTVGLHRWGLPVGPRASPRQAREARPNRRHGPAGGLRERRPGRDRRPRPRHRREPQQRRSGLRRARSKGRDEPAALPTVPATASSRSTPTGKPTGTTTVPMATVRRSSSSGRSSTRGSTAAGTATPASASWASPPAPAPPRPSHQRRTASSGCSTWRRQRAAAGSWPSATSRTWEAPTTFTAWRSSIDEPQLSGCGCPAAPAVDPGPTPRHEAGRRPTPCEVQSERSSLSGW